MMFQQVKFLFLPHSRPFFGYRPFEWQVIDTAETFLFVTKPGFDAACQNFGQIFFGGCRFFFARKVFGKKFADFFWGVDRKVVDTVEWKLQNFNLSSRLKNFKAPVVEKMMIYELIVLESKRNMSWNFNNSRNCLGAVSIKYFFFQPWYVAKNIYLN